MEAVWESLVSRSGAAGDSLALWYDATYMLPTFPANVVAYNRQEPITK